MESEEKDQKMVGRLDEIRLRSADTITTENRFATREAAVEFAQAFRDYGVNRDNLEAASMLTQRPAFIRDRLVAALDSWVRWSHDAEERSWVQATAEAADPDSWRKSIRQATTGRDRQALERLAVETDVSQQSPQTIDVDPSNYFAHNNLGSLLREQGNLSAAIANHRRAIELAPNHATAHNNLAHALLEQGDPAGAVAASRRAEELDPSLNVASNLALAQQQLHETRDYRTSIHDKPYIPEAMRELDAEPLARGAKASWSPDGTEIVYSTMPHGTGLELLDLRTRQSRRLIDTGKDSAFCPIGPGLIAYVRGHNYDEEVWVVDTQGENDRKIAAGGFPCWSADGQTLYFQSRNDWKIRAVDMSDRSEPNPQLTVVHTVPNAWYPAVSPDGRWVAYAHSGQFVLVNLTSGEKTSRELRGRGGLVGWSPDSRLVGFSGFGNSAHAGLWGMEVRSGELKRLAQGDYTMPVWSRDGTKIAFDSRNARNIREIWLVDAKILERTSPYQPSPDQSTLPATDADSERLD